MAVAAPVVEVPEPVGEGGPDPIEDVESRVERIGRMEENLGALLAGLSLLGFVAGIVMLCLCIAAGTGDSNAMVAAYMIASGLTGAVFGSLLVILVRILRRLAFIQEQIGDKQI